MTSSSTACGCSTSPGAEQSFRNGTLVNWQLQYVKDRAAIPMTREYIHEESARLRELGERCRNGGSIRLCGRRRR